ncbi:MAG: hypothetical protein IT518_19610 [Burkholderiales bacterium]|nr:hypothetical protein [Burkholderiales bacterium]
MSPTLPAVRRLVLGGALLAATLVAILPEAPPAGAQPSPPTALAQDTAQAAGDAKEAAREAAREAKETAREAAREARETAREAAREAKEAARGARIQIDDREYDSFDQFLDRDPALATMVLGVVFIVFLTPILIIALVVWYKMRKARMQNEATLKLAEKGIAPPEMRKHAAWSDLRKGVLFGGVGLALTVYGFLDDGQPGWLALILLFVGIGYVVLWHFEDRQMAASVANPANRSPDPGPGDTSR